MITTQQIQLVEKALGITLYYDQIQYIRHGIDGFLYRRSGKTTAYIVRLLLTEGPSIKKREVGKFSDMKHLQHYSNTFFIDEVRKIKDKLDAVGLKTREII